ncbi:nucleotide-binding protein [Pseudomonas sp. YeP6b]|uniref:nucleotide-binding protein n=1 Tax=Pseudomonas sp. YeP6b TaxID=2861775 RepID=UPI0021DADE60|nr:nucleotide-binding protein [Pseudomonas sp. YeP6b]UXZ22882.1 nucleotide-binding protein [Pseudomonas sp. YeP6b]
MLKKWSIRHAHGSVKMRKPRIFLASSVEGLGVANAINECLDYDSEIVHWKAGFSLSSNTIDSLMEKSRTVDFAIFVFTPDDVSTIREQSHIVVRDNVLFELGLFIGRLTKERCFIIKPRDIELHFPTDLLGLTPADYDGNRSDKDLTQAVGAPCNKVKKEIVRLGLATDDIEIIKAQTKKTGFDYEVGDTELRLLLEIFEKGLHSVEGVASNEIFNDSRQSDFSSIAIIKIERLGLIEKEVRAYNMHEYYTYSITPDGLEYILTNETKLKASRKPTPAVRPSKTKDKTFDSFDDDIPF